MEIVEVKNITKRFNDKLVLDNISFKVEEGEIFGFIGPNGAGKSTLINIMTTILEMDNGEVKICGYDIKKEGIKAKENIGYVPQELSILEELSAFDNLEFFGALQGLSGKVLKERIDEALEIAGLKEKKKQKVKKFSGGMKRRLNLAIGVLNHPKVLILDEPTVGVDPQSRNYIFTFIKKIAKEWGTTVIYTSHYMEEIEELCSRVFIMDLGKEVAYGTKEMIKNSTFSNNKIIIELEEVFGETIILAKDIKGVLSLDYDEKRIILNVNEEFKLGEALTLLEEKSLNIKKITYEDVKLEDVFLSITGKNLRD